MLPFLDSVKREQTNCLNTVPLKPSLNHGIPKGWERNEDLALAIVIFGDTNEAVGSEGSHEESLNQMAFHPPSQAR